MTVHIIFSDGSRRMSQNTNDLRERWEMRREFNGSAVVEESTQGYAIPRLDSYGDMDEMLTMKQLYTDMITAIDARSRLLGTRPKYAAQRVHLNMTRVEIHAALTMLSEHIKRANIARSESETRINFERLIRYAHELEQLLMDEGFSLPPAPYEEWKPGRRIRKEKQETA